jgi:hypothetical protein
MPPEPPTDAAQDHTGASHGKLTLVGQQEVQVYRLDRPWLTQEALDQASRTVSDWPCLGPSQWCAVADALGLSLKDHRQPFG